MRRSLLLLLFLSIGLLLYAQEPVRFGDREVYLEANVHAKVRGHKTSSLELGIPTGEKLNVLVQFGIEKIVYDVLKQKGVELGDYLGGNAYYAQITPGSRPSDFVGTGLRTVAPIRGEWKVVNSLLQNTAPDWAVDGARLKMTLSWFSGVSWVNVKSLLEKKQIAYHAASEPLQTVEIEGTRDAILALASEECVSFITWTAPPQEITNYHGARLSGASVLSLPPLQNGRGLTGKGIRIGIWDGNVGDHVDYGSRVHRCEFEQSITGTGAHGMHTTGTIVGSGLLNPRTQGMAPEAQIWTYNFTVVSNGKPIPQKMYEAYMAEDISLTSNSYGLKIKNICGRDELFNYTLMGNSNVDYLSCNIPTLTHVYAAGNDQYACQRPFSHSGNYSKNIISVGALDAFGTITDFSSFGPLLDGRIYPIVSAYGYAVLSTVDGQRYERMNGTSMACPTVTGHLALLTQRWKQLHGGALPTNYFLKALIANTADDAGNLGPDYKYGFGILNAEAAVTVIEGRTYELAQLTTDTQKRDLTLQVPNGVQELRVMLCWNDPVARKEYLTGESPLVNDLDLSVTSGGTTHLPLTLDFKHPSALAQEAVNKVDNIEQVIIKNPAQGEYILTVNGVLKQGDKQPYALVWYFDYQQPTIVSPAMGDIFAAGDTVYLRTRNMQSPLSVSFSTDDGTTYTVLGSYDANAAVVLPKSLAPTNGAILRATDANNQTLEVAQLTIMGQVKGVKLTTSPCSSDGWKLAWEEVADAAHYEILKGDIEKGSYEKVAEVAAPALEYVISSSDVVLGRNVYAVRAVSSTGIGGQRSVGVLSQAAMPLMLSEQQLPFFDSFVGTPFRYVTTEAGKKIKFRKEEALENYALPFDSHMLVWQPSRPASAWENPFVTQRDNVGAVSMCEIDLSAISAGTALKFVANYYMAKSAKPKGSLLRLLVDNEEIADELGRTQIAGDSDEHFAAWDFSEYAGKKIRVKLEFALATPQDGIVLISYQLMTKTQQPDVGIVWANVPEISAKAYMENEDIRFKVQNFSSVEAQNIPVSVQVDGEVVYSYLIETLKPFEDRIFSYKHNFASREARKYVVDIRTSVKDDAKPQNNEATFGVYNMGEVLTMPEVTYVEFMGSLFPQIPYETRRFSGHQKFVDGRGELGSYNPGEFAVLKLLPAAPNSVLQATFLKQELAVSDTLFVFTGNVPSNLQDISTKDASYILTGRASDPSTFISEATDGALTFILIGYNKIPGEGWIANLSELPMPNQWQLLKIKEVAGSDAVHSKLELTVNNLLPVPFYNVGVYLSVDGVTKRLAIPQLPAGESIVVLDEELSIAPPMRSEVLVTLASDGDVSDNSQKCLIQHDPIGKLGGKITSPNALYIAEVAVVGEKDTIRLLPSEYITYKPECKIPLYTKSENALRVRLSGKPTQEQSVAKLRIWTNLDGNNELKDEAPELIVVPLQKDKSGYEAVINLSAVTSIALGEQRMRVMLATDEGYALFKEGKEMEWGSVVDFTALIREGVSPNDYELALLRFQSPKTAHTLGAAEPISLKVRNNGLAKLTSIALTCIIDNLTFDETVNCDIAPRGGVGTVTLSHRADLSLEGKHTIQLALKNKDVNEADNSLKLTVFNIPARTEDLYSLSFVGDKEEYVSFPRVARNIENEATVEGWWYLNKPQMSGLVYGGENGIQVLSLAGHKDYPDNSLVVLIGPNGGYVSKQPVIKPEQWQHIAVTLVQDEDMFTGNMLTTAEVFIDGQKIELKRLRYDGFKLEHLWANVRLQGQNAMFRLWNTVRTPAEIKDNMCKSVRIADGTLPTGCEAEFLYTEGRSQASASGDEHFAMIRSERTDVWKKLERVVRSVEVAQQVRPTEHEGSAMTITLPQAFVGFDKVKLQFLSDWADAEITYSGAVITSDTEIDFSQNSEHKLAFKAVKSDLFGKTLTQDFTVQLKNDLSNACDIEELALLKLKNSGLKGDLTINNPSTLIVLDTGDEVLSDEFDASHVCLTIKRLSAGAKLYYGADEIVMGASGAEVSLDLTSPRKLRVVAQNGYDAKTYTVRLAMAQTITWSEEKIVRPFASVSLALDATTSSALVVRYNSLDPSVATVDAAGNLIAAGVGKTKLLAYQEGNGQYKPAPIKEREVEITRADLTIKVKDVTMAQGDMLPPLEFEYEGLQFEGTEREFTWSYEIQTSDGQVCSTDQQLVPGVYRIVPKEYSGAYESGNYRVTRENGKLTVLEAQRAKAITFVAKDQNDAPLAGVVVQCDAYTYITQADGKVTLYLLPKQKSYRVLASKLGYVSAEQSFVVSEAAEVTLKLLQRVYKLTYQTDAFGIISGSSEQMIAAQHDGGQVVAVPRDRQHRFKQWSDGVTTAARIDKNVTANVNATAEFEPYFYTLTYSVSGGGEFVSAEDTQVQKIVPGADGQVVTVKAKAGYVFLGWEDGERNLSRTDRSVWEDKSVKAIFFKPYRLSWTENFDNDAITLQGWEYGSSKYGRGWQIFPEKTITNKPDAAGKVLAIAPRFEPAPKPIYADCWVASPWLALEGGSAVSKLQLTYTHRMLVIGLTTAHVEYCFEDGAWVKAHDIPAGVAAQAATFELEASTLATHKYVRIRWVFTTPSSFTYLAIDNIKVTFIPEVVQQTLRYFAEENGLLQKQGENEKVAYLELQTPKDIPATKVVAVPNEGFSFDRWSDGFESAERQDARDVTAVAMFRVKPKPTYTITYLLGEHGAALLGSPYQSRTEGDYTAPVTAVAQTGFRFLQWNDGVKNNPRTDKVTAENKTFTAQFTQIFTLTYVAGDGGTIVGTTPQTVDAGGSGTEVEAKANAGYRFVKWDDGITTAKRTETNVQASKTYTAQFAADVKTFAVTLTQGAHGTISIKDYTAEQLQAVAKDTKLTVVVTPDAGWKLKTLTANGADIAATKTFTVTADVEVNVEFEKEGSAPQPKTFAVTLAKEGEGELKVTGIEEAKLNAVPEGTKLTAVATPATGWKLKSLTAGTQDILADGKFTVTADVEVKAVFEKATSVEDAVLANVLVAPNPFTTQLRLLCNGATGRYDLLNAQGVVVRSGSMAGNEVLIETSDLTSGLYLLRLTAENGATNTITVVKDR